MISQWTHNGLFVIKMKLRNLNLIELNKVLRARMKIQFYIYSIG